MVAPTFYKSLNVDVTELVNISGAKLLNLELAKRKIFRLASLANSDDTSLVFIENKKHIAALEALHAAAIFCPAHLVAYVPTNIAILLCSQPHLSFCKIADNLLGPKKKTDSYISPHAKIADSAVLEEGVTIEAGACIGERAQIGSGTIIKSGAIIADNCTIGRNCFIGYNTNIQYAMIGDEVSIHSGSSLGQDGFGYIIQADGITKVPQMGRIIIQDKVEIGANTTIDRGSLDDTIIGAGTKIDNLVQIGHNVVIGRNCIIAAHTGIAGSVIIGDNTMLGSNVGIKDHIKIGDNVQIMAASGVMNDIKDGEKWGGIPARPVKQWFREVATLRNIVGIDK